MKTIQTNNYDFHYTEKGEGNAVILVHGSITDHRTWNYQIDPFSKQFHVFAYNRRYHHPWNSDEDVSDYDVPLHANDLTAFIETLDFEKVNLVGSSYGAYTGLTVTMENPGLVNSLVLCEPPVIPLLVSNMNNPLQILSLLFRDYPTGKSFLKFGMKAISPAKKQLRKGDDEEAVRLFANGVFGEGGFENLPEEIQSRIVANAPALKAELLGPGFPGFSKEEASEMNIPVLLVSGENSPRFFRTISDKLHNLLPNSKYFVIPGVSHKMHVANPEMFNEKVLEFLNNHN